MSSIKMIFTAREFGTECGIDEAGYHDIKETPLQVQAEALSIDSASNCSKQNKQTNQNDQNNQNDQTNQINAASSNVNCTAYTISFTNTSEKIWRGIINIELAAPQTNPRFFMPGYMYGRNTAEMPNCGRKHWPRIRAGKTQLPESEWWMTRSDRLAMPISLVYDEGHIFGISAEPFRTAKFSGFTCRYNRIINETEVYDIRSAASDYAPNNTDADSNTPDTIPTPYASCGYTLGYENAPWLFIQSATPVERRPLTDKNVIDIVSGETISVQIYVYNYEGAKITDIYAAFRDVYAKWHHAPRTIEGMTDELALKELTDALYDCAYLPKEKMYTGFVHDRRVGHVYDPETGYEYNKIESLSWTNGLTVAVPMLLAGMKLGDSAKITQAVTCIDYMLDNCINPANGLPFEAVDDGVWSNHGWWYDGMHTPGHTGYLCGQAVYYVLKAVDYIRRYCDCSITPSSDISKGSSAYVNTEAGTEYSAPSLQDAAKMNDASKSDDATKLQSLSEKWLTFASDIVGRINTTLNSDYEYPFAFSEETGAGLEYNSLGSSWCLAATVYEMIMTGDRTYLNNVIRSEQHYYDKYVARCECYGGPLDTDKAIDNEGILAYVRVACKLHELTKDDKYLEHMKDALDYECSFKLCYNTPVSVPPLSTVGWSSCGGSITSVANPHIHPMSSTIIPEMQYYVNHAGDEYIISRLSDTINWGLQTFNTYDGEYGYGKIGWMSERFCFCEGLMTEQFDDGTPASTWLTLMSWASGSIIEGFI